MFVQTTRECKKVARALLWSTQTTTGRFMLQGGRANVPAFPVDSFGGGLIVSIEPHREAERGIVLSVFPRVRGR